MDFIHLDAIGIDNMAKATLIAANRARNAMYTPEEVAIYAVDTLKHIRELLNKQDKPRGSDEK